MQVASPKYWATALPLGRAGSALYRSLLLRKLGDFQIRAGAAPPSDPPGLLLQEKALGHALI